LAAKLQKMLETRKFSAAFLNRTYVLGGVTTEYHGESGVLLLKNRRKACFWGRDLEDELIILIFVENYLLI